MTATDELRQLLEERNEEYDIRVNSGGLPSYVLVGWYFNLADRAYFYGYPDGRTKLITYRCTYDLTPEQAIAATLGRGTPTADDVRDLIERHSDASGGNGRDFHNGAYVAIADELNATLGRGTCHDTHEARWFRCSACGFGIEDMYVNDEDEYPPEDQPRYCPNCGRLVVEVDA